MTLGGSEEMLVDIINEQVRTEQVKLIIVTDLYHPNIRQLFTNAQWQKIMIEVRASKFWVKKWFL